MAVAYDEGLSPSHPTITGLEGFYNGLLGGSRGCPPIISLFKTFLFIWGCIGFDSKGEVRNGEKQSCLKMANK